jgi:hypothetical protein
VGVRAWTVNYENHSKVHGALVDTQPQPRILDKRQAFKIQNKKIPAITYIALQNKTGSPQAWAEGFRSIVNQKISYGCEQESQDLI